ncbi:MULTISPECIES: MGMT family protein [unclassified Arthrobacter]|uniref:MGMT family protein n=1 Tax=unclassified Arthrobacter TaxID=235627 RepID=UPI001D13BA1B|nr:MULTISPECIES: MGMT family protein [unclassified Arthrobacter]MCC3276795.1 MGMT family protein [Arthrobacter sp. zg-Y20]MCC3277774.1 MGMT family protein [Arthrobacter sp. zg-Y40]MCC9176178.1 MGMT family protein [Arthrobacter sp. zg-Y750]MDK1316954.1 MGMT family protein [Arthrobacter sp. zg.Y20]MDK1327131.1 MGMT family protein [Arthrobacter sp. zg-Y1143]
MRRDYADAVLGVADLIPPGKVLSYGDIAELLGAGGPRQVGAVLSARGSEVCWWRVLRASGQPPRCHEARAWEHYRREGTPVRGTADDDGAGYRVLIGAARWQPNDAEWAAVQALHMSLHPSPHAGGASGPDGTAISGMSAGHDEVEP